MLCGVCADCRVCLWSLRGVISMCVCVCGGVGGVCVCVWACLCGL